MESVDDRSTVREFAQQELGFFRDLLERVPNNQRAKKWIAIYEDELSWFNTDEERVVYQLEYEPDCPWIFTRREEAEDWLDNWDNDVGDDIPKPEIIELRMTGRQVGDLHQEDY